MKKVIILCGSEQINNLSDKELEFIRKNDIIYVNKTAQYINSTFKNNSNKRFIVATDESYIDLLLKYNYHFFSKLAFRKNSKLMDKYDCKHPNIEIYCQSFDIKNDKMIPDYDDLSINNDVFLNKGANSACMALLYACKKEYKEIYFFGLRGSGNNFKIKTHNYSEWFFEKSIEWFNKIIPQLEKKGYMIYNTDREHKFDMKLKEI